MRNNVIEIAKIVKMRTKFSRLNAIAAAVVLFCTHDSELHEKTL